MREEKPSYGKANGLKQEIESKKQKAESKKQKTENKYKYKAQKSAKEAKIDEWK